MTALGYNINSQVSLPDSTLVGDCGHPDGQPIGDIQSAVRTALKAPLEFPPLADATIAEDRVAIVLQAGIASAEQIVAGVVGELAESGIDPRNVCALITSADELDAASLAEACQRFDVHDAIELVVHRPNERESLAFLGTDRDGEPVYINRRIVDAEFVIPIGALHPRRTLADLGIHGTIVPWYSDVNTLRRFFSPRSSLSSAEKSHRRHEARRIAWMLGTRLTVQVVPGDGDANLTVLAGDAEHVARRGTEICDRVWKFTVPQPADLVVAGISGGSRQQNWSSFARTLRVAQRLVTDDGAIAVCCGLNGHPSPSLRKIAGAPSLESAAKVVVKDRTPDALSATLLLRALARCRVYLLSNMDPEFVEELGMAAVSDPAEITRLAKRHSSCIAIQNAQRAIVSVEGE